MNATEHLEVIYGRIADLEDAEQKYGLQVTGITPTSEITLTERFSGVEKLKESIQKARDMQFSAVKVVFFGSPDVRAKEKSTEIVAFNPDFLKPQKRENETQQPVEQRNTLIDDPEKLKALNTLGGLESLMGFTNQLNEKTSRIQMLEMQHNFEKQNLMREADLLREKILRLSDENAKIKADLEIEKKEKDGLKSKNEELSGLEARLAPREMLNEVGAKVLTNIAQKMILKNKALAGLMGFDDEPETEEANNTQQSNADVQFEQAPEPESNLQKAVREISQYLMQIPPLYTDKIIALINFARDIDERHAVLGEAMRNYLQIVKNTNHAEIDSED